MKLTLRIAALTIVCMSLSQTALAASYSAEDQEQLTLECLLTNNKYASAFIAQDSAGYATGTQSAPTAELNLVTNQPGVNAYYNSQMIAGGSLYWIRVVKGPYEYIVYDKEQHGDMSGVVVTKKGKESSTKIARNLSRWVHKTMAASLAELRKKIQKAIVLSI